MTATQRAADVARVTKLKFREGELAEALDHYTDPTHPEYHAELDAMIRALRPDWFAERSDAEDEKWLAVQERALARTLLPDDAE